MLSEEKISEESKFTSLAIKIFHQPAQTLGKHMPSIRKSLLKAGNRSPPEQFIAKVMLSSLIATPMAFLGLLLFIILGNFIGLLLVPAPILVFLIGLVVPNMMSSSKSGAIDAELPYVLSYFSLLSGGGISLLVTLRRVSKVKLFPIFSREAKTILTDIDMGGLDPVSALEKTSRTTPNKLLKDFLSGYTTLLRTGGRLSSYMDAKIREVFTYRVTRMKSAQGTIALFAEAYVAATVVMGLCFYLIFALQGVVNQTGYSGLSNAIFFSAVFIPLISIVFFYLTDSVQVKNEPGVSFQHHRITFISLSAVPLIILLAIDFPLYIKMGIGFMIASIPTAIKYERESRSRKAIENMLPNFIRDIAEVRKTGQSPERCIQQVANQDYGKLSPYIKKMSSQISWGVPIRKVMENFSNSIRVWSAKAVTFILLEVVDLGGGTSNMFENIAEFTQKMKEMVREQTSSLRPLIVVPYFGSVMTIATTLLMMNFLQGEGAAEVDTSITQSVLLTGAVAQAWIMGFTSGKMGEGSMGAGFKHSIALVALSIATIMIMPIFFSGM
jgi:flagellar protein FlaJ